MGMASWSSHHAGSWSVCGLILAPPCMCKNKHEQNFKLCLQHTHRAAAALGAWTPPLMCGRPRPGRRMEAGGAGSFADRTRSMTPWYPGMQEEEAHVCSKASLPRCMLPRRQPHWPLTCSHNTPKYAIVKAVNARMER